MANSTPIYKSDFLSFSPGEGLPVISEKLDAIRAYQWEVHFAGIPGNAIAGQDEEDLTLAAKQISQVGVTVEDIPVHRVNDVVHYPGKPSPEEMVITFDNLLKNRTGTKLWEWFTQIYDPVTGEMTKSVSTGGGGLEGKFKCNRTEIIQLDNNLEPVNTIELYGVYPKKWTNAELNYSTNEFNTVEITFRYDFMRSALYNG